MVGLELLSPALLLLLLPLPHKHQRLAASDRQGGGREEGGRQHRQIPAALPRETSAAAAETDPSPGGRCRRTRPPRRQAANGSARRAQTREAANGGAPCRSAPPPLPAPSYHGALRARGAPPGAEQPMGSWRCLRPAPRGSAAPAPPPARAPQLRARSAGVGGAAPPGGAGAARPLTGGAGGRAPGPGQRGPAAAPDRPRGRALGRLNATVELLSARGSFPLSSLFSFWKARWSGECSPRAAFPQPCMEVRRGLAERRLPVPPPARPSAAECTSSRTGKQR
ncbi:collagen alpha-1(I) chain-like [Passer domesticus]|uniref:collagen alpha-1(I) chain-like n=1 Tax=Passer domesticus TaxID=48849 RepID=UPI0030FE7E38